MTATTIPTSRDDPTLEIDPKEMGLSARNIDNWRYAGIIGDRKGSI